MLERLRSDVDPDISDERQMSPASATIVQSRGKVVCYIPHLDFRGGSDYLAVLTSAKLGRDEKPLSWLEEF